MNAKIIPLSTPEAKPTISVIMVSYMTGPALLESVQAVLEDRDIHELILVDNGNSSQARTRLSQIVMAHDKVRLLQGHGNVGFAKGCNYGAKFATSDMLLFLNPDAVITAGAARKLADVGAERTHPWIAGGLLRDIHGREQRGGRREELTPWSAFVSFTGLHKLPFFDSLHLENRPVPAESIAVPVISGAFFMMDRPSFNRVGGFDESYFLHVEDIDICRRVKQDGGEVYFVPQATVLHYGSTSRIPRMKIEWEKLKGFIIYFWRYSDKAWAKVLAFLAIPFMTLAIMGRAAFLSLRLSLLGR